MTRREAAAGCGMLVLVGVFVLGFLCACLAMVLVAWLGS